MRKLLTSLLLGSTLTVFGQNFTNSVNSDVTKEATFKYNYNVDNKNIQGPIYFFFDYTNLKNSNTGFEGQLTHDGKTITMFHNDDVMPNRYVSGPITTFNGLSSKGNWEFHVHTPEGTSIGNWGVFTIPEPSMISLLGIGMITLLIKRK